MKRAVIAVLAGALLLGFGCGDDKVNVLATGVRLVDDAGASAGMAVRPQIALSSDVVYVGHPTRVGITINSSDYIENLALHLYVIDRIEFDLDPDNATQFLIGVASIDEVRSGEREYVLEMLVPYTDHDFDETTGEPVYDGNLLIPLRDYYLFAQLDPADRIKETNEEDNRPALDEFATRALVTSLSDEKRDDPNVFLSDIVLDLDLRMVDMTTLEPEPGPPPVQFCTEAPDAEDPGPFDVLLDDFGDTQVGLSAIVNATGAYIVEGVPSPIPRVDLQATFHWESDDPLSPQVWDIPVLLWNSQAEAYERTVSVEELAPGEPRTIHVDLRLDADLDPSIATQLFTLREHIFGALPACIAPGTVCGLDVGADVCDPFTGSFEQCLATIDLQCAYDCFVDTAGSGSIEVEVLAYGAGGELLEDVEIPGFSFDTSGELPEINVLPPSVASVADDACGGLCPEPTGSQLYETGFHKDFSSGAIGKLAGARVDFDAMAALSVLGASASANGIAGLTLFGFDFEVMGLDASGAATPSSSGDNYFELDLRSDFAFSRDRILFSKAMKPCGQGGITVDATDLAWEALSRRALDDCKADCSIGDTACLEACDALARSFYQSRDVKRTFFISIVPVTATFSAGAGVGFSTGIGLPACDERDAGLFQAHAGPFAEVDSEVSAGVGISGLFSVGAAAVATLIEDTFYARAQVVDLGIDFINGRLEGLLGEDVVNTLTGPNGGGYLFVRYPCGIKWCGWYPCLKTCTSRKDLFRFETFEKRDVLFCEEQRVSVEIPGL